MSDTPKTDELAKREFVTDGVWIRHARELERENAALRAHAERVGEANDRLVVESDELRKDQERLDWLTNSLGWIVVGNVNEADPSQHAKEGDTLADAWRAAIDAAMKEAQQ